MKAQLIARTVSLLAILALLGGLLVPALPAHAAGSVEYVIDIVPGTAGIQTGDISTTANATFSVQAWVKLKGGAQTNGATVYISYDPVYLEVTGVTQNQASANLFKSTPGEIYNDIGVASGTHGQIAALSVDFLVATFAFRTKTTGTLGTAIDILMDDGDYPTKDSNDPPLPVDSTTGTTVTVLTQPVAAFSASSTTTTAGDNVTFTDSSTGPIENWAWDFNNDGVTDSTVQNPSWGFGSVAGIYTVKLTVSNASFSDNETKTNYITVNPAAPAKVVYNPAPASPVTAGATWTSFNAEIRDQYDNLTTSTANITVAPSSGSFASGASNKAAVSGVATFDDLTYTTAGTITVTASSSGLTSATSGDITVGPAAANKLVYNPAPASSVVAGATWTTFNVEILDQYDNLTTSTANVTVTPASGSFASGTTTRAAVGGIATFNNLTYTTADTITVTASSGALTTATSGDITVSPAAADHLMFQTAPSSPVTAGATWSAFSVKITDQYHNLISSSANISVTITGDAFSSGTATKAAVGGMATFDDLTYTTAGTVTVTASASGLTSAESGNVVVNPAAAAKLVYNPAPASSVTAGATWTTFKVEILDQYDNLTTSTANVTVTPSSGSFASGDANKAAVGGIATFDNLTYTTAATLTLTASSGGLTPVTSDNVTVNPAAAAKLVYNPAPASSVTAGATWTMFKVEIRDQYDNLVNSTANVTVTPSSGSFASGDANKAAVGGIATFNNLTYTTAGTITVTASSGALTTATSGGITVGPAALAQVAISPSSTSLVVTTSVEFTATGQDEYGNTVLASFTWSVVTGGGTIVGDNTTAEFTAGSTPGTFTDTVKATAVEDTDVFGFATVTVTGVNVTVTVKMQGGSRPEAGLNIPFAAKLFSTGVTLTSVNILTATPIADFTTSDWSPGGSGNLTITATDYANKTVTLRLTGVLPGTYQLSLVSPHNLVNLRGGVVVTTSGAAVNMGTLLEGNANNSNRTDITDFGILAAAYLATSASGNWDNGRADFDRNGQVTILDFSLLALNFNKWAPVAVTD